jgi:hypothetical protein
MLDRNSIIQAVARLAALLRERRTSGEMCLFGGSAMVMVWRARPSTRDVDAVFSPPGLIRSLADRVRKEQDLAEGWLNNGVSRFLSHKNHVALLGYAKFNTLRVLAPSPRYMLAMKLIASRIALAPGEPEDIQDIRYLVRHLRLGSPQAALTIASGYYRDDWIPSRAKYLLDEIFSGTTKPSVVSKFESSDSAAASVV